MSAGLELPRKVWVHGWLLAQGRADEQEPRQLPRPGDVVKAFGPDGARYVTLREVAFDQDTEVPGTLPPAYNADLANDFGNLSTGPSRWPAATSVASGRAAAAGALAAAWPATLGRYAAKSTRCLLHEALATLWHFVGEANRDVDAQQPWVLAKAAKARRRGGRGASRAACWATCSRRAASSRSRSRRSCPDRAARPAQLGHEYAYAPGWQRRAAAARPARRGATRRACRAGWGAAAALPAAEAEAVDLGVDCLIVDPDSSRIRRPRRRSPGMAKHGEFSHIEFPADDPERAKSFYVNVFGWSIQTMDRFNHYFLYTAGPGDLGGGFGFRSAPAVVRNYLASTRRCLAREGRPRTAARSSSPRPTSASAGTRR